MGWTAGYDIRGMSAGGLARGVGHLAPVWAGRVRRGGRGNAPRVSAGMVIVSMGGCVVCSMTPVWLLRPLGLLTPAQRVETRCLGEDFPEMGLELVTASFGDGGNRKGGFGEK